MNKYSILVLISISSSVFSWSGYDYTNGCYIEVESYDHGYSGQGEVEYYDYCSGEYKYGYMDMYPGGSGDIYVYDSGEYIYVDMD
jgi:hypothetical protein